MGYLAKHVKVKRYKAQMLLIATAALRGAMFGRTTNHNIPGNPTYWYVGDTREDFNKTWGRSKSHCAHKYHLYCDRKKRRAAGLVFRQERMVAPP